MYIRLEYFIDAIPILIKGTSYYDPIEMYEMEIGQVFSATKGINFYLLFQATSESRGKFIFSLWQSTTPGIGERESSIVSFEEDPNEINEDQ